MVDPRFYGLNLKQLGGPGSGEIWKVVPFFVSNGMFGERNVKNFEGCGFPLMKLKFLFCMFSLKLNIICKLLFHLKFVGNVSFFFWGVSLVYFLCTRLVPLIALSFSDNFPH